MDTKRVLYRDMGTVEWERCRDVQAGIFDFLVRGKIFAADERYDVEQGGDREVPTLILCEHPHVYTLGRSGRESNMLLGGDMLARIGAHMVRTDRGGDVTYHGPGQLVGYPVLDLDRLGMGLREYVHRLEGALIDTAAGFGIAGRREAGAAGVWLAPGNGRPLRKIAAIGVRSSRGVVMHGFALNVSTDMRYFAHINPCGFTDRGVASIEEETGRGVAMDEVKKEFARCFERNFGAELVTQL